MINRPGVSFEFACSRNLEICPAVRLFDRSRLSQGIWLKILILRMLTRFSSCWETERSFSLFWTWLFSDVPAPLKA